MVQVNLAQPEMKMQLARSRSREHRFSFSWPEFGTLIRDDASYNKFTGPNRISIVYNSALVNEKTLKSVGFSRGAGIYVSGNIRHNITVSAGLVYQAKNFSKTVYSGKVPPHNLSVPADSIDRALYIDSTVVKGGNYTLVEIPLALKLRFLQTKKSSLSVSAGVSLIFCPGQKYYVNTIVGTNSTGSVLSSAAWRKTAFPGSVNAGFVYEYSLSERLSMILSAEYKFRTGGSVTSMQFNLLSLEAGLGYRFGKIK